MLGQYSTGKTSFIKALLGKEYPGWSCHLILFTEILIMWVLFTSCAFLWFIFCRDVHSSRAIYIICYYLSYIILYSYSYFSGMYIAAEPATDNFVAVLRGAQEDAIPGTALVRIIVYHHSITTNYQHKIKLVINIGNSERRWITFRNHFIPWGKLLGITSCRCHKNHIWSYFSKKNRNFFCCNVSSQFPLLQRFRGAYVSSGAEILDDLVIIDTPGTLDGDGIKSCWKSASIFFCHTKNYAHNRQAVNSKGRGQKDKITQLLIRRVVKKINILRKGWPTFHPLPWSAGRDFFPVCAWPYISQNGRVAV